MKAAITGKSLATGALAAGALAAGTILLWIYGAAPAAWAQSKSARTVPAPQEPRLITSIDGATLYHEYCAVCHGTDAKGDGPMALMLVHPTPDLTQIAKRHDGKFPRMRIENVISGETALPAGHGTRDMPVWGPLFSKVTRDVDLGRVRVDNISRYLESIQEK